MSVSEPEGEPADATTRIAELEQRLEQAEEALRAIRAGEVDAIVVVANGRERIMTFETADRTYRLMVEQMRQGAALLDPSGIVLYSNSALAAMTGRPLSALTATPFRSLIDAGAWDILRHYLQDDTVATTQHELNLVRPDGGTVPAYVSLSRSSEAQTIIAVITDLTEQHTRERLEREAAERIRLTRRIEESEARQRFLLALSDVLGDTAEPESSLATATELLGQQIGAARVEHVDTDELADAIVVHTANGHAHRADPGWLDSLGAAIAADLRHGKTIVVGNVHADPRTSSAPAFVAGSTAAVVAVPSLDAGRLAAVLVVHDIAPRDWTAEAVRLTEEVARRIWAALERTRGERRLRNSEERFRQFAEASPDVLWIRNAETLEWEYLSRAFERIYGLSRQYMLGDASLDRWTELVHPDDRANATATVARVRSGTRATFEYRLKRPWDTRVQWLRTTAFPLFDPAGGVQRIGGITQDISAAEEAAERMRVLVGELQHRTRNVIAVATSIARDTISGATSLDSFWADYSRRLAALERAQGLLSRAEVDPITLRRLVFTELDALGSDKVWRRILLDGPEVTLRKGTVQTLALAVHELAVDSLERGALGSPNGQMRIVWRIQESEGQGRRIALEWIEEGADPTEHDSDPRRRGRGRDLVETMLSASIGAETRLVKTDGGLHCTILLPFTAARAGGAEHRA